MSGNVDQQDAIEALKEFLAAMREWESAIIADSDRMDELETEGEYREAMRAHREKLAAVYDGYCEVGRDVKRLKDPGLSYATDTPDYDPGDKVVEAKTRGNCVEIQVKEAASLHLMKYEMKNVGGKWLVKDNRKRWSNMHNKWINFPL